MEGIQVATRIQLRRDVEDDWFRDNPILRSGEIGISLDLNTFKIGDGQTPWRDLDYALAGTIDEYIPLNQKSVPGGVAALDSAGKVPDSQIPAGIARDSEVSLAISTEVENRNSAITNAISNLIDTAPDALNTLNEIAAAINDDASYAATITTALGTKANLSDVTAATAAAAADATTKANAAQAAAASDATSKASAAQAAATAAAASDATSKASAAQAAAISAAETDATTKANAAQAAAISAAATDATTKSSAAQAAAISAAATDATTKANAAQAAAITAAGTDATTKVEAEAALRVSGDAASVSTAAADATTKANAAQAAAISAAAADATTKANAAQAAASSAADTKVSSAIAALTKSSVGLANVDNTADASKPVSAAQATAIATAKSEAIADATAQVNAVIASAPAALNTLDELAAALGDDASFAATVTANLSSKAPIASPTFTGTVSGITKTMVGLGNVDNTSDTNKPISSLTQTALNAKSDNLISTAGTTSTSYSITSSDLYKRIEFNSASPITVTIPADITLNLPIGSSIELLQANTGKITVQGESVSVLIYGPDNQFKSRVQWSSIFIEKRAANSWLVTGDTEA
jgi:hypothetical protein